jgi:hypothetical protein
MCGGRLLREEPVEVVGVNFDLREQLLCLFEFFLVSLTGEFDLLFLLGDPLLDIYLFNGISTGRDLFSL